MRKTNQIEMEMKLREITWVNDPDQQFVESLWQKIEQQEGAPMKTNKQRSLFARPVFIILAVVLLLISALFIGFGPQKVSAFIRDIFSSYDPGLQDVEEAGLVTDMGMSAEPSFLPEEDVSTEVHQVHPVGQSQTIDTNSLTLDWVYADEGRLALAFTIDALREGLTVGEPVLTFNGFTPARTSGSMVAMDPETRQMMVASYHLIQVDVVGESIGFSVDLPVILSDDPTQEPVTQFHFDVVNVPLYRGFTIYMQQTYQVTLNGVSVQLESVQITPDYTDVTICSDLENKGVPLESVQDATFQFGEGPVISPTSQQIVNTDSGRYCNALRFPTSNPDNSFTAKLTLDSLIATGSGELISGHWPFYMDIPTAALFVTEETPEISSTPIASQTQSDVTVTLDWVFVDALRAGVGYTITGLPDVPEAAGLLGEIHLSDAEGNLIDGSGIYSSEISRVEGEPGVIQGTWSTGFREPLQVSEISLEWVITLDGTETMYAIAGFPPDPEATPYPRGEHPPFLPDTFVGTYTFDFTAEIHPIITLENLLATTVNGIQMSIPKALVTPSMAKVMVCYQKPTERDWWIYEASLGSLKEKSPMVGGHLVYDADFILKPGTEADGVLWVVPDDFQAVEHGRCLILNFLQGQSNPANPLILTVDGLQASAPEIYPEDELAAAREILLTQGIEFDYYTTQGQGGGGGGIDFFVLPEGMTDEEAYQKFNEAMGYIFTGPWVITLID